MGTPEIDVAVVGGGIIGLASALALTDEGFSVSVFDDAPGRGASHAAAGMLAPGAEATPEHAVLAGRSILAKQMWPEFARRIGVSADKSVLIHSVGSLFVGWNASDQREIDRYFATAHDQGITSLSTSQQSHSTLFTGLSPRILGGEFVATDAFVDPDEVISALIHSLLERGVRFVSEKAIGCESSRDGVLVSTLNSTYYARCGIVASGYQESPLDLLASSQHKLRPIRGVTLHLRSYVSGPVPMIRATIQGRQAYVIRRGDGSVVVGASSDESSDRVVEAGTVRRLLEDACTIMPELDEAELVEARVGLRPAASEQLPFFEELDGGVWAWSSGHYRHGFLLAPLAAQDALDFARRVCRCD